jgi:xylulokinase
MLIGGGARSAAVQRIAPSVLGVPVDVPAPGEYVAGGAARQAAWALSGDPRPPAWSAQPADAAPIRHEADIQPEVRDRYRDAQQMFLSTARP